MVFDKLPTISDIYILIITIYLIIIKKLDYTKAKLLAAWVTWSLDKEKEI